MSDNYKFGFDETPDNEKHPKQSHSTEALYHTQSNVRNLDFVWPSGNRQFFNYAYLVTTKYSQDPEETIVLIFTTDTVQLKGVRLLKLYLLIRDHSIKLIVCSEKRYNETFDDNDFLVNYIEIKML